MAGLPQSETTTNSNSSDDIVAVHHHMCDEVCIDKVDSKQRIVD